MSESSPAELSIERRRVSAALRAGQHEQARTMLDSLWARASVAPIESPLEGADLFQRLAEDFVRLGDVERAEQAGSRGLAFERRLERPVLRRNSLMFLADLRVRRGDLEGSKPLAREALALYEKDLGPDHSEVRAVREFLRRADESA